MSCDGLTIGHWQRRAAMEELRTDVLVIGGGIAGQLAALAARRCGAEVTLAHRGLGASPFILGANVVDSDRGDSLAQYSADMIEAGSRLCDPALVNALVSGGTATLDLLEELGVPFARDETGPKRRHLSGNRHPRSLYVPDGTGRAILRALQPELKRLGVHQFQGMRAIKLLSAEHGVVGAVFVSTRHGFVTVRSAATVLASGGIGRLYEDSTYPADVVGDSYALALQAGATLRDMEFIQFEPTVTVRPSGCRGMEMPTAMLGDGAALRNNSGDRFMFRVNPEHGEKRIEKAKMALAIQREIDEGRGIEGEGVLFDTTLLEKPVLESYVTHVARLRRAGLEPFDRGPLVRPAAHSAMGGVRIKPDGASDVPGLFAIGEAAGGVHGASRIAGNGGGEVLAMGPIVGTAAACHARLGSSSSQGIRADGRLSLPKLEGSAARALLKGLRKLMSSSCGILRRGDQLVSALTAVRAWRGALQLGEPTNATAEIGANATVRSALLSAESILASALVREESRGAHQRLDAPMLVSDFDRPVTAKMLGSTVAASV